MKTQAYKIVFGVLLIMVLSPLATLSVVAQPGYDPQPGYNGSPYDMQPGYSGGPGYDMPVEDFYDELAPYGQWMQTPEYGRVWVPQAETGFQPYASNGHWVVTEYGNTWVSDYPWGWAPFHYGRWYYDNFYGWAWVPGREWAPAWVCWRSGGGYYGWAPLGPGINVSVNINIPYNYWVFVPQMYITSPRVYNYCLPRNRAVTIINNTTIINNVYRHNNRSYFYGPRRQDLEYATRRNVPVYRADDIYRNGRGNGARGSYGMNNGGNRGNNPAWGQSNRTGVYRGPSDGTPNNDRNAYPGTNRNSYPGNDRGRNDVPQRSAEGPVPSQDNVPNKGRRGSYSQQSQTPTDRTGAPQGDYSGWGRSNRGGMYRGPSGDASANSGVTPQRAERQRSFEAPSQQSVPTLRQMPHMEKPSSRGQGESMQRGQSSGQGQRQQSSPDLGGGHGGNGRRGPR